MVGLPGEASNMTPPTVCIIALTVWQVALIMLARGRVSAWLARRGPWTWVIAVGSLAMTLYLWHITAMVALYGLVLAAGGPLPVPGTGAWWATRPVWLALLAAVLTLMALALSRFERPGGGARDATAAALAVETRTGRLAVVLGLVLATLGLLGFTTAGFTPLVNPEATLPLLPVGPLQSLVYLVAGSSLARAARTGLTGPQGWRNSSRRSASSAAARGSPASAGARHATTASGRTSTAPSGPRP
jgi:hypothetical protein